MLSGGERWAELEWEELATDRCARIQRETCCMLPCTEERVSNTILLLSLRYYADLHLIGDYWNSK